MTPVGSGQWLVADDVPDGAAEPAVVYRLGGEHGLVADGRIDSYRDLRVWQEAMDVAERVYIASRAFPADERFGLTAQLRHSVISVLGRGLLGLLRSLSP